MRGVLSLLVVVSQVDLSVKGYKVSRGEPTSDLAQPPPIREEELDQEEKEEENDMADFIITLSCPELEWLVPSEGAPQAGEVVVMFPLRCEDPLWFHRQVESLQQVIPTSEGHSFMNLAAVWGSTLSSSRHLSQVSSMHHSSTSKVQVQGAAIQHYPWTKSAIRHRVTASLHFSEHAAIKVVDIQGNEIGQEVLSIRDLLVVRGGSGSSQYRGMGGGGGERKGGRRQRVVMDLTSGGQLRARLTVDVTVRAYRRPAAVVAGGT